MSGRLLQARGHVVMTPDQQLSIFFPIGRADEMIE